MTDSVDSGDTAPCVGCGLCCNGVLYRKAKVTPGEEPRLIDHGLKILNEGEKVYFALPCRWSDCGSCSIYETRFDICRSFRCGLLRRYQAGEVTIEQARAKVEQALAMIEQAATEDEACRLYESRTARRRQLAEALPGLAGEEKKEAGKTLLAIVALDTFLQRWFKDKNVGGSETKPESDSASNS